MTKVRFTKGYVDTVVRSFFDKEEAKKWLRERLNDIRRQITDEHYHEMLNYINEK